MNLPANTTDPALVSKNDDIELTERERKFLKRMTSKYGNPNRNPLLQSILVFTALIGVGHLIERAPLPWWAALALVYIPGVYLFSRYRKFGIFKSKLMCKLAMREQADQERRSCS